jgi:hypothetical protein
VTKKKMTRRGQSRVPTPPKQPPSQRAQPEQEARSLVDHPQEAPYVEQDKESAPDLTDEEKKYYDGTRTDLAKWTLDAIGKYDQYIITLSSGALALSVLFLEKVVRKPEPSTLIWIFMSWSFFAFTLLLSLFSFLLSHWAWGRQRSLLEIRWHQRMSLELPKHLLRISQLKVGSQNRYDSCLYGVNFASFILFFLGVTSFVAFGYKNSKTLLEGDSMNGNEVTRPLPEGDKEQRGAPVIPLAPPPRPPAPQPAQQPRETSQPKQATDK